MSVVVECLLLLPLHGGSLAQLTAGLLPVGRLEAEHRSRLDDRIADSEWTHGLMRITAAP
jgi:hypothetical protein